MQYKLIRSNRRTIAAQIKQNRLIVRAPLHASQEDIDGFLMHHRRWIENHLTKARARTEANEGIRRLTDDELRALADQALTVIPQRVAYYAPLIGVTYCRCSEISCQSPFLYKIACGA